MKILESKYLFSFVFSSVFFCGNVFAEPNIHWGITITGGTPPPAGRYESVPPPRPGQVWIPGYWGWQGGVHVWMPGHWERARAGYVYVDPVWREGPRGWELHPGGWKAGDQGKRGAHCPPGQHKKGHC